jgi:hypothetical protein
VRVRSAFAFSDVHRRVKMTRHRNVKGVRRRNVKGARRYCRNVSVANCGMTERSVHAQKYQAAAG